MHTFRLICLFLITFITLSVWAEENPRLTVLTYNIHHGEGIDGKLDLQRIADVINSVTPDLVALQEVDVKTTRVNGVDQAAELGRLTGMSSHFTQAIPHAGGEYGDAILIRKSRLRFLHNFYKHPPFTEGRERRVINECIVELRGTKSPGQMVRFYCTHLDHLRDENDRLPSAKTINQWICEDSERWQGADKLSFNPNTPSILSGDLNARPDSNTIKELKKRWIIAGDEKLLSFPSEKPTIQIDYIMYRPHNRWRVIHARVLDEPIASDHRPVLAVLELLPE